MTAFVNMPSVASSYSSVISTTSSIVLKRASGLWYGTSFQSSSKAKCSSWFIPSPFGTGNRLCHWSASSAPSIASGMGDGGSGLPSYALPSEQYCSMTWSAMVLGSSSGLYPILSRMACAITPVWKMDLSYGVFIFHSLTACGQWFECILMVVGWYAGFVLPPLLSISVSSSLFSSNFLILVSSLCGLAPSHPVLFLAVLRSLTIFSSSLIFIVLPLPYVGLVP